MSNISRAHAIELLEYDCNTLHAVNWHEMTAATGLDEACFYVRFTNTSPQYIFISYNGVDVNDVVPPEDSIEIYFQANASYSQKSNNLGKGQHIYLRGAPTAGEFVYLSGYTYVE
jgi:hypothetical protein